MKLVALASKFIRRLLVGKEQKFVFTQKEKVSFPPIKKIDFYIHIPFCKSMCPYCPYNRIVYDRKLVKPYLDAILEEIDFYHEKFGRLEIPSIYIGGGTPTNMIDELGIILDVLRNKFTVSGDICIETSPSDLNTENIAKMKTMGIDLLSVGIQSFENRHLKILGRNYDSHKAEDALKLALSANFKSVNVDLMFVLPNQIEKDVLADFEKAVALGVDQITAYPLFTFPYSSIGRHLKLSKINMPNFLTRRVMYRKIHNFFVQCGYQRVSVWGFRKGAAPRYSSVTRDNYIGLGAGACSRLPEIFYFNTFSVKEYIDCSVKKKSSIALVMDITPQLSLLYWLYWRFYDTEIFKGVLKERFGRSDFKIRLLFVGQKLFGLCRENNYSYQLTERGSFYIHLIQNYFILNYINKVWTIAQKSPWPLKIDI